MSDPYLGAYNATAAGADAAPAQAPKPVPPPPPPPAGGSAVTPDGDGGDDDLSTMGDVASPSGAPPPPPPGGSAAPAPAIFSHSPMPLVPYSSVLGNPVPRVTSHALVTVDDDGDDGGDSSSDDETVKPNKSRRTDAKTHADARPKTPPPKPSDLQETIHMLHADKAKTDARLERQAVQIAQLEKRVEQLSAGPPGGSRAGAPAPAKAWTASSAPRTASARSYVPNAVAVDDDDDDDVPVQDFSSSVLEAIGFIKAALRSPSGLAVSILANYDTLKDLQTNMIRATPQTYIWKNKLGGKTGTRAANLQVQTGTLIWKIIDEIQSNQAAFFATSLPAVLLNKSSKNIIQQVQFALERHRGGHKTIDAAGVARDRLKNYDDKAEMNLYTLPQYMPDTGLFLATDTMPPDTAEYNSLTGRQKAGKKGAVTRRNRDYAILKELVDLTNELTELKNDFAKTIGECCEQRCMKEALQKIFSSMGHAAGLNASIRSLLDSIAGHSKDSTDSEL